MIVYNWVCSFRWYEVCLAVGSYLLIHFWRQRNRKGAAICWPLVGMLPSLVVNLERLYEWLTEILKAKEGTCVFRGPWLCGMQSVLTCDPRNIEYALKINFPNYPKGQEFHRLFEDLLGDGIFNADSESWLLQRKIASLQFTSQAFRQFTANTVQDMVENRLVPLLADVADRSASVDLQDVFLRYTFDNTCTAVFGKNPGCLAPELPAIPFATAFDDSVEATMFRHVMPRICWQVSRLLNIGKERQFLRALKPLREFVDDLIAFKKAAIAAAGEMQDQDLLSSFMRNNDGGDGGGGAAGASFSDKFFRDTVMNFVIAGRDTSAVALTWFFWCLSQHPHVEDNILAELDEVRQRSKDCGGAAAEQRLQCSGGSAAQRFLTGKELQECVYLQAALMETLRLYPSVPVDHKGVLAEDILPDGTCIRPGMRFMYSIYSLGRMESIWGPDCLEFKPERWICVGEDGRLRIKYESMYKFLAFNAGPRVCLGKEMAYMQMKCAAAAIISRFRVRVAANHRATHKLSIILTMKNGLPVTVTRRELGL
ncbi:cytochrome P450 86B1 [Cryptomeria japonica]|uniref:cytochrome P450 86B1 n=1 Tax=Cryptomeria japonica TaxID=3369 RepID=UPI0027DA8E51|nr:cytochrome P450 86B1 [Cryptomeria japonica]